MHTAWRTVVTKYTPRILKYSLITQRIEDLTLSLGAIGLRLGASDFSERERERDRERGEREERERREAGRPTQTTSPGMLSKRESPAQPRPAGSAGAAHPTKRAARRGYKCCGW